jgi:regulatory protein
LSFAYKPKKPREPLDALALLDFAAKSLGSRMKSERDLRRKLVERAAPDEEGRAIVDAVMIKLKQMGYLSDERFAADFTRLRQENDKFGRRRVQQGLMQRGIAPTLTDTTLTTAYENVDEVQLCREYIARKRLKAPCAKDREVRQKESAKLMRRLIAAGFSSRAIFTVLRQWQPDLAESDVEPLNE